MTGNEGDVDVRDVRRRAAALGLAAADGELERWNEILAGADQDKLGAVMVALAQAWVGALDMAAGASGASEPRALVREWLYEELEKATSL
ncbi:hypothetical protein [Streptomyces cyaneofuscatus]|uniref:hypothetical protein n=1 Tax=Streptomyces cyaneofuscatus TaxID=66883 RepID=UPI0036692D77